MALRVPRGYDRNRPYFKELCEGVRPNSQALVRTAYTGLPHVRIDEVAHDPFVIDAGTLIGMPTGSSQGSGTFVPAVMTTGATANACYLKVAGSADALSYWGLPNASGNINCNIVKPMGVCYEPVYSFILESKFTNYKRTHSVGILTDYVIQIPVTNDEEVLINEGDLVQLGSGNHTGAGWTSPWSLNRMAGRYAKYDSTRVASSDLGFLMNERIVGRCLKRTHLGWSSSCSQGDLLSDCLSTFTISTMAASEFAGLDRVQTVPGLAVSGSGTKGIPAFLLGARADAANGSFWALTILIRL